MLNLLRLDDRIVPAGTLTELIAVDQIGWRASAPKIAVFIDPLDGPNAALSYTPGSTFQVRRVSNDSIAYTGNTTVWSSGVMHSQSGDKAWHGDFSTLTTPGEYYLYDPTNDVRSFSFRIQPDIYNDVLEAAGRVFFYQRSGITKTVANAGNWAHPASHLQETTALKIVNSTAQSGTARNVSGGWWDAGDYNKYVPFTTNVIWDLASAYEWNPGAFSDAWNIPESGNGTPDILDELRYELDWLLKMQLGNGSVLNRVGQASYNIGNSPELDTQPHYYTGATTWATASFAASTAHAARVFASFDATYANTLRTAAEAAWSYLSANTSMLPANGQDGGTLAAADGGANTGMDRRLRVLAAAELFKLTGTAAYKTYFDANYNQSALAENGHHPIINTRFDPSLATDLNRALVTYASTTGANTSIVTSIKTALKNHIDWNIVPNYANQDPYRGYMWDGHYCWGSNQLKATWANFLTYAIKLNVGTSTEQSNYRNIAEEYLHYYHGRNPIALTMLTNMGSRGADVGADKMPWQPYHGWWPDGSAKYDGESSQFGPAPGYVIGGVNQYFSVNFITPPYGTRAMKAYKDWNTVWNNQYQTTENPWEITEPAIYYQATYLQLVSQFATAVPAVSSVSINSGAAQRSRVTTINVTFTAPVDATTLAPTFTRGSTVVSGPSIVITPTSATNVTLTFTGSSGVDHGSLADGVWTFQLLNHTSTIKRLFGDLNGDGTVDGGSDFAGFTLGSGNLAFDFNNDGTIDGGTDFAEFGTRFGRTI